MIDLKKVIMKEKKVDTVLTKSNLPIAGYSINTYVGCPFGCKYCYAITDIFEIIEEIKDFCDYIWLENLNLRGTFKPIIINYFYHEKIRQPSKNKK